MSEVQAPQQECTRVFKRRAGALVRAAWLCAFASLAMACGPTYPNCDNDDQCHEAEYCVNGHCQQCRPGGEDCPDGQSCNDGRCDPIEGYCASESDCPNGQECQNNRCVSPSVAMGDTGSGPSTPTACSLTSVSFAYDQSDLDGPARSALEANARCVQERDIAHVQVVGHCDPRGTEEYNLALGDRRARSVRSHLGRLGVDQGRMGVSSMGEEMARGTSDSTWAQDRRVEILER